MASPFLFLLLALLLPPPSLLFFFFKVCVRYSTNDASGNDLVRESKLSLIDLAG